MKTLLVRPPRIKQAITLSDFMFSEPLGLEMIYGVLKEKHKVEIFDMMVDQINLEEKLKDYRPDVLGITSLCIDVNKVIELSVEAKALYPQIIIFVGGTQTYLNSDAFKVESIDHIFKFTNKNNLEEFINRVETGIIFTIDGVLSKELKYLSTENNGRNEYLLPDRSSTKKYRNEYSYFGYKPAAIMEFGTGCQKTCEFCLRWRIEGYKEELIDIDLVKQDLKSIEEPTIMIFDNDFFANENKVITFINIVKELNLEKNFIVYASVTGVLDYEEYLGELKTLGLKAVLIGYESFNDKEMEEYHKKATIEDNLKASEILKKYKIDTWASFIANPDWTVGDFKSLRSYIKRLNTEISSISPLTPFPNLPMYNEYKDRLIYSKDDYEKWSFGQVMIKPSQITLRKYYYELLKTNLYVNLLSNGKTEMLNKFGLGNVLRILLGSIGTFVKYINLMLKA